MTKEQIKHMVDRFLGWKLPTHFNPDNGISFDPISNKGHAFESRREPVGTNLFDATQADAMVRHMVEGMPDASKTEFCWLIERGDSEVSRPLYWKGTNMGTDPGAWAVDPNNAVQFSCQSCADVVAHNLMGRGETRIRCRVKEHGFG